MSFDAVVRYIAAPKHPIKIDVPLYLWDVNATGACEFRLEKARSHPQKVGFFGTWGDGTVSDGLDNCVRLFHLTHELNKNQITPFEAYLIDNTNTTCQFEDFGNSVRDKRNQELVTMHERYGGTIGVLDGSNLHSARCLAKVCDKVVVVQRVPSTAIAQVKTRYLFNLRAKIFLIPDCDVLDAKRPLDRVLSEHGISMTGFYFDFTCTFGAVNWNDFVAMISGFSWFMVTLCLRNWKNTFSDFERFIATVAFEKTKTFRNGNVITFLCEAVVKCALAPRPLRKRVRVEKPEPSSKKNCVKRISAKYNGRWTSAALIGDYVCWPGFYEKLSDFAPSEIIVKA